MVEKYFFVDRAGSNLCHGGARGVPGRHFSDVGCGCDYPNLQSSAATLRAVSRQMVQISQSWCQLRSRLVGILLLDPRQSAGQSRSRGIFGFAWMCSGLYLQLIVCLL